MRPATLPPADRYPHGKRARYVCGCRCDACRAANAAYYHERKQRGIEAAAEIGGADAGPIAKAWRPPGGAVRTRTYARACPGVFGEPCAAGAHLRSDSKGVCERCRGRLSFNGLVDAAPVRKRLKYLSRAGVGRDSVSAACDVAASVIAAVYAGTKRKVRARTARAILAVTAAARADAAKVPAGATWKVIDKLVAKGWTRRELARRLGSQAHTPVLQIRTDRILARTALAVKRLDRTLGEPPVRGTRWQPVLCDCLAPRPFRRRCDGCGHLLRPDGVTQAVIAGGPETTKPVHRAFGYEGGWSFEQRTSKKARAREEKELRQLARGARSAA